MAPEISAGARLYPKYSGKCDMYSLGIILKDCIKNNYANISDCEILVKLMASLTEVDPRRRITPDDFFNNYFIRNVSNFKKNIN